MATKDILCFLEYFADRDSVINESGNRTPTYQWQNFYQAAQALSVDTNATGSYFYLAFDVDGFGSSGASEINDLSITAAATAQLVDITDTAIGSDNLVIASLYVQDAGQPELDSGSAQLVSRYIGSIEGATVDDVSVQWTVNPAINKLKPQVPTRKITAGMLIRQFGS
jgi:hypothetical protein|tara:strand:- start:4449 stop:4952 length:504 start_codon:yes stop_codon:yes gene_type:complete